MGIYPVPQCVSIEQKESLLEVLILAGGSGERMGLEKPKQFYQLKAYPGKCVLDLSLEFYQKHPEVCSITVVSCEKYREEVCFVASKYSKVKEVVIGGKTRQQSVYNGLKTLKAKYVLIQDAARPIIKLYSVNACIHALKEGFQTVNTVFQPAAMMVKIENSLITQFYSTEKIAHGQCPQGFLLDTLKKAHDVCLNIDQEFKDDCSLVYHIYPKLPIYVVKGSYDGFKITYPEDLILLEALLREQLISDDLL